MTIDAIKLENELARKSEPFSVLYSVVSSKTVQKIKRGQSIGPKTAGKIASFLEMPVEDLRA